MSKTLVAYFSASGTTARVAKTLAEAIGADLFQVEPEVPYSDEDLSWTNKHSRSSVEMSDPSFRPQIVGTVDNVDQYDRVFVGFPIWWYVAPTIINTFLESCDLSGKTVVPFATSGSSGMGKTNESLADSCKGASLQQGTRFDADVSASELKQWAEGF